MSQASAWVENQSGLAFRGDLNAVLGAISSLQSGTSVPSALPAEAGGGYVAYQLWADTNAGLLKIRDGSTSSFITIGTLGVANLGLATLASPSFTGTATFAGNVFLTGTGAIDVPVGTTNQRPGGPEDPGTPPSTGMIRFNTTIGQYEGYNGATWSSIGGGATGGGSDTVFVETSNTVTTSYQLTSGKNAVSAGPVTVNAGVTVTVPSGQSWVIV